MWWAIARPQGTQSIEERHNERDALWPDSHHLAPIFWRIKFEGISKTTIISNNSVWPLLSWSCVIPTSTNNVPVRALPVFPQLQGPEKQSQTH